MHEVIPLLWSCLVISPFGAEVRSILSFGTHYAVWEKVLPYSGALEVSLLPNKTGAFHGYVETVGIE